MIENKKFKKERSFNLEWIIAWVCIVAIFIVVANVVWLLSMTEITINNIIVTSIGFVAIWIVGVAIAVWIKDVEM